MNPCITSWREDQVKTTPGYEQYVSVIINFMRFVTKISAKCFSLFRTNVWTYFSDFKNLICIIVKCTQDYDHVLITKKLYFKGHDCYKGPKTDTKIYFTKSYFSQVILISGEQLILL